MGLAHKGYWPLTWKQGQRNFLTKYLCSELVSVKMFKGEVEKGQKMRGP